MKKIGIFLKVIISCVFLLILGSCSETNQYVFISDDYLYSAGTQTITVPTSDSGKYSSGITKDQISLPESMRGKAVDSVTYVDENKITITISGKLETINTTESYTSHTFSILKKGLTGNDTANVIVNIYNYGPSMTAYMASNSTIGGTKVCSSHFQLPYGEFIATNCTTSTVVLPNNNGTITNVDVIDNELYIRITGYVSTSNDDLYPIVEIDSSCTTFNKTVYVRIGYTFETAVLTD